MKNPTTFKPADLVVAMITNLVFFAKNQFNDFSNLFFHKKGVNYLKAIKIKSTAILVFLLFFAFNVVQAQVGTKFSGRLVDKDNNKYLKVQGDIKLIGNTILTPKDKALPFNDAGNNNDLDAVYVDIDGDNSTVSSSSANLLINNGCKRIVFAGLYWSAMYPNETSTDGNCFNCGTNARSDWNEVKFKMPGKAYETLTADKANPKEVIFKGSNANDFNNSVYVCFKDVTAKLQSLTDADGTYTVGNIRATRGIRRGGSAGGWTLVVIYESPTVSSKYISVFDGAQMTNVDQGTDQLLSVDIPISGFKTLPAPFSVKAKIGVAALDGDYSKNGDGLLFKNGLVPTSTANSAFTPITNTLNPTTLTPETDSNFFNATITVDNAQVTNRNPTNRNNLGFDIDYLEIPNPTNSVIPNGATDGTFRMFTNTTGGDGYAAFLATFAVDIIEPKITLTKQVFDYSTSPPTNMEGKDVTLGKELNYVIGFQNQGNDHAVNFTIVDKLPINTKFNYPADIISLPPDIVIAGVTYKVTHTYDAANRIITFTIPNQFVEKNDPRYTIRFKVKVVESCNEISDVCSNIIANKATSSYSGEENKSVFGDDSLSSYTSCNIGIPQSTNFLVDVDDCKFEKTEILCGTSIQIKAANGYSSYSWSTSPTGTPVIGTSQTLTVVKEGVYYVKNTAPAPCLSIAEKFTVTLPNNLLENPVLPYARAPYAGNITQCPDSGKFLPNLFLCGASDFRDIKTGISATGTTIVWEKLVEGEPQCPAVANDKCANEGEFCTWKQVATGPDYKADTKGQYRLTIRYQNDCFNQFYFNVYKNELNPTVTYNDIYCNTKGRITVNGVPAGYEYSLTKNGTYKDSNVFSPINTAGNYTVYIKQKNVTTNPCIFEVSVSIVDRKLVVETIPTHPICFGEKGSIKVNTSGVRGQYYYELFRGSTSVQKVGPVANADQLFNNLDAGNYSFTVRTDDGCTYTSNTVRINSPAGEIKATPSIKTPLTSCSAGKILITTSQSGNNSNAFYYFVNGSATFQTSNEIDVTTPGTYSIRVVGTNNCEKTVSIVVPDNAKPTYNVTKTDINCYEDKAEIRIIDIVANGHTMSYSIGGAFQSSPVFSNLAAGTYNLVVKYTLGGVECQNPAEQYIITGPTSALTASAGVGELAGCGPLQGGQPTGLLRITNVQGGTAPYQYSFDGGANWQASFEKYVVASTASYDLRVRDSKGCIYKIPYDVILDPKPADPVIDSNINPVYNCDGTATATVVVNTPTSSGATYSYEYYLQTGTGTPVANTPITSGTFYNVPSGNHTVIVKYKVETVSSYSNLLQENFGSGAPTTSPGIAAAYCFNDQRVNPPYTCSLNGTPTRSVEDNQYSVASFFWRNDTAWYPFKDHTTNGVDPNGRYLLVNIGEAAGVNGILYSKPIVDVIPNQPIIVDLYVANLLNINYGGAAPIVRFELVDGSGNVVATQDTGKIAEATNDPNRTKWVPISISLDPKNNTNLTFRIRSGSTERGGNDLIIDDIWVRQLPKSCGNEKSVPVVINSNSAFNAPTPIFQDTKCSTSNDGSITITATNFNTTTGFYYSINNGPWNTSTTSPRIISGLGAGMYNVIVKYNSADSAGKCEFKFDSEIKSPQGILFQVDKTDPTCTTGGTITATTVTGGTGSYQYQLSNSSGIVVPFQTNKTFSNVAQGTYRVQVKDANDCLSQPSAPITITNPTAPTATLAASTDWCYTPSNPASLVVTASGGVGPYTYKLDNNTPITTNTFNNVAPGTHTILVTDSNNCTATISNIIIEPQLQLNASLAQDLTCLADASINAVVTGGYGPYTYTVSRNGATAVTVTSFPYTATQSGSYVFTVTDSKSCPATSTVVVSAKTTPTLTSNKTDITCYNANDGTITVTASNGATTVYTYAIKLSSAATYTTQSTNQFTGLAAGTYNIKVIDSKGCESAVSDVTIINPMAVGGNIGATELKCSATGTVPAVVTITATGGSGSYQYSFNGTSNFTNANTYSTSVSGTVTAYIKDANGCQFGPLSVTIGVLEPITDITIVDNGYDCSTNPVGGQVTVTAVKTGVANPFSYQIISGPSGYNATANSTGIFQGLAAGSYVFQATDTQTNCTFAKPHTISGIPAITAGGSVTAPISCYGGTGNIQFTVSGVSTSGYDYVVRNSANVTVDSNTNQTANTVNLNNLSAGSYTITVTDIKTKCPATYSVTLAQPSAAVSITSAVGTNVNCNNDNSQITVTATGGTPAYTYAYAINPSAVPTSAYASGSVFTIDTNSGANLAWDIYVKDANGCIAKRRVDIISDNTPSLTVSVDNQCTGSGSGFTITATPSSTSLAPLSYSIGGATGTFQSSPVFTVSAGTYTVHIKDANGCTVPSAAVTVYPQLTATSAVTRELSCSPTTPEAQITLTVSGGRTAYSYEVSANGGSTYTAMASNVYTTATAGTYTFRVTDSNTPGCRVTTTATVNTISDPTVTATQVNVSCNGGASNGSVTLTGAGGSGGYTYSNNATSGFTATATFTGLAAGPYTFYVKDSKGCTGLVNVTITQPTALTTTASATAFSCNTTNVKQSAVVTVAVPTTGTAPYTYSFEGSAFTGTRTFTVSDNGTDQTIHYIVKDNNGCTYSDSVVINRLNPPVISGITHTDIYCAPASRTTSTVTVAKAAGTGVGTTFTYEITAPAASVTSNTTGIFSGLAGGVTYSFKVTDASGCYSIGSHTVPVVNPIAATATKLNDVYCNGGSTGSIRYDVSQFTSTYSYKVNTDPAVTAQSAASFTLPNLGVGTYAVVFTDETTGCTASTSITITQPTVLSAGYTAVNANCNVATSKVTITASGGTPTYTYAYKQDGVAPVAADYVASNSADLNPLTNANWDVWVKDANGCTVKVDVAVSTDNAPTAVVATGSGCLGTPGGYTISTSVTGGTGTLSYSINGGSYQSSNIFTITSVGTYTIRVKDANGCTADSNSVTVAPQLTLSAVLNKDITCNPAPTAAQITLTPTGGAGPFIYTSSPNTGTFAGNVFSTSTPGNYTFTVTDTNTCSASTTTAIVVTPTVNPVIDDTTLPGNIGVTQIQSINCNGDDTAAIAIAIDNTKGLAPFVFNIKNNTTGFDYGTQTSGLAAGVYTVTLTDARGCTDTEDITITQPFDIVVTSHAVPITCNGSGISKGSVIVDSVTGGVGPYDYIVTGVNGYNNSELNNAGTTSVSFNVVDFGLYQINVVDANGCSKLVQNVLVASPPNDLDITVSAAPGVCSGLGSALVAVSSSPTSTIGTGPFYFSLYTGSAPSYPTGTWLAETPAGSKQTTFNNLIPGVTYTFVVYDAAPIHGGTGTGCYYYETAEFPIGTSSTITVNPLVESNITCKGAANGNVTFTMNQTYGVDTPVKYQIYNSQNVTPIGGVVSATIPAAGSLTVNNFGTLPFGNYFVLITEDTGATNAGCSVSSAPFSITQSAIDLSVTASKIKNVNCNADGVIAALAKDGTAPYTYQYLLASATAPTASTAGWTGNTTFATSITGNYIVYAKDAYGCIKTAAVTLDADDAPIVTPPATSVCYDGTPFTITFSGTVDPDIVGGATYSVNGSAFQASPSFTFNAAGTYNLVIKDGNGCTANVDYEVYPKLNLSASLTKELDCTTSPAATITLNTTGGNTIPASNYTYEVNFNNGGFVSATNPYSATTAGNYVFRVTDANNATVCRTTTSFDLDPIPTTVFGTTVTNVSCNGGVDGTITVNVTAGEGPYKYSLDGGVTEQTTNTFTGLSAGTAYIVTVRNARNCTLNSLPVTITEPVLLAATASVTPFGCNSGNVAQPAVVTVTATSGTGTFPYTYSFNGSTTYSGVNTLVVSDNGTDQIIAYSVKDANGCIVNGSTTVNRYLP
ncbi:SprB repeat-containing protein, partial [Flavobacterium hydrophilum]